jgi:hypothetical protein
MKRSERSSMIAARNMEIYDDWRYLPRYSFLGLYVLEEGEDFLAKKYKLRTNTIRRIVYKQMQLEDVMDALGGKFA